MNRFLSVTVIKEKIEIEMLSNHEGIDIKKILSWPDSPDSLKKRKEKNLCFCVVEFPKSTTFRARSSSTEMRHQC